MNNYHLVQILLVLLTFLYVYSNLLRSRYSRLALTNNKKHAETLEGKLQDLEMHLKSARSSKNEISKDLFLQRTNNQFLLDKVSALESKIKAFQEKETLLSIELKAKDEKIKILQEENEENSQRLTVLLNERQDLACSFEEQSRIQFQRLQDNILDSIDHFSQSLIEETNLAQEKIYESIQETLNAQ